MTREQILKEFPEATQEQLTRLLDINCSDVEKGKGKLTAVEEELKEAKETISTMTAEIQALRDSNATAEDYKAKLEELQNEIKLKEEKAREEAADKELTDKITLLFPKDKQFTSEYVRKGLIADIKAKYAKDNTKGLQAYFDELTQDKEGIFASQNPPGQMSGMGNVEAGVTIEEFKQMGYADRLKVKTDQPELYQSLSKGD